MRRIKNLSTLAGLLLSAGGCVTCTDFFHPGTVQQQQARAQVYEPFPEPDTGPPIVGGRPREYANPQPEVQRVQPPKGDPILMPNAPAYYPPAGNPAPAYAPAGYPSAGYAPAGPPVNVCPPGTAPTMP